MGPRCLFLSLHHPCCNRPIATARLSNPCYLSRRSLGVGGSAVAPNFPRNLAPDFGQYISERLEMISQDEKSPKAKTVKGKNTYENKINEDQY